MHVRLLTPLLISLCAAFPAFAQQAGFTLSQAYRDCTATAASAPQQALTTAEEWLKIDSGVAPHHCRAMALYGLKRYEEAAAELELVRNLTPSSQSAMRSYVTEQSSQAWMQAGKPQNALSILTMQIDELTSSKSDNLTQAKEAVTLLKSRSAIRVTYGQLPQAVQDLDQAISLSPGDESVLLARAKAFVQLKEPALAKQDLDLLLRLNPTHTEARSVLQTIAPASATTP